MPTTPTIRVRSIPGTRWNSNVNRYRATAAGRQATIPNPFDRDPYVAAAQTLADRLGLTLGAEDTTRAADTVRYFTTTEG